MKQIKRILTYFAALAMGLCALSPCAAAEQAAAPVNYARGCTVMSCTSGESKSASNAVDGSYDTDWATYSATTEGTVELSLTEPVTINKVVLTKGSFNRTFYVRVETSLDGYDWTVQQKDVMFSATSIEINLDNAKCEFVKISIYNITPAGTYYGFSISEIELYKDDNIDKSGLMESVEETESMLTKFRGMSGDEVTVPEDAYTVLQAAADQGNAVIADTEVSQYRVDLTAASVSAAREEFLGMVTFSDALFDRILEEQKSRQINPNSTYDGCDELWQTMDKSPNAEQLWEYTWVNPPEESGFLTAWGDNLYKMVRAYLMKSPNQGNQDLRRDIENALDWLYENKYNETVVPYGNHWNWSIGGPKRFIQILVAMKDDLDPKLIEKYCYAMRHFMGTYQVTSDGANRTDCALVDIQASAFLKDGVGLYKAQNCILGDLSYVDNGAKLTSPTGHYRDGSFLYHAGLSYNGNYGKETLNSASGILQITKGTPFQVDDAYLNILKEWAVNAYDPLAYKGHFSFAAKGRGIYGGVSGAQNVSGILTKVAACVDEPDATLIQSIALKMGQKASTDTVVADSNIAMHKRYPSMDRTAHLTDEFGFYLSTYSPRTILFEATNGEDMLGWYQSAGMFYLETNDNTYYDDGYYETIDPYRMPGVTLDTVTRNNKRWDGESTNPYSFVGGAQIGDYGIEAMEFGLPHTDLYGKKSWFMFDDEIVFVGSDITAATGRTIETVVDNRKIRNDNQNKLVADGKVKSGELGKVQQFVPTAEPKEVGQDIPRGEELAAGYQEKLKSPKWIFLEDNGQDAAGSGYVFLKSTDVNVKREERIGCEAVTHYGGSTEEVSRNWVTMWIDHGANPEKASYEYVLLPARTQEEVAAYAAQPTVKVLKNTSAVHAVKETAKNMLGVNSFAEDGSTVEGVTVDKPASYMLYESENYYEISVSDPTRQDTGKIHVQLDMPADTILYRDDRIENVVLGETVSFDVDISYARGMDYRIVLGKPGIFTGISEAAFQNTYLQIGNTAAVAGGRTQEITAPVLEGDLTLIPVRFAAEALGARVSWDEATERIQIIGEDHVSILTLGSTVMKVDGREVQLETAPKTINDYTMVPLRAVAEAMDAAVNWQEQNQVVEVVPAGGNSAIEQAAVMFERIN